MKIAPDLVSTIPTFTCSHVNLQEIKEFFEIHKSIQCNIYLSRADISKEFCEWLLTADMGQIKRCTGHNCIIKELFKNRGKINSQEFEYEINQLITLNLLNNMF